MSEVIEKTTEKLPKCVSCKRPSLHYFAERRWTHELKQKRHYKNNTVKWQRISDGNGKIIKNNI